MHDGVRLVWSSQEAQKQGSQPLEVGFVLDSDGAGERNRTLDLLITNELLYQLSYTGVQAQNSSMTFWA